MGGIKKAFKAITGSKPKKKSEPAPVAAKPTSTQPSNLAAQDQASLQAALDEQKKRRLGTVLQDATGGQPDQLG